MPAPNGRDGDEARRRFHRLQIAAVFFVLGGFLLFVAAIHTHFGYRAILDALPPQFRDDWTSRYAFSVYALEPTTPLDVQASYIKAMGLSC